MLAHIYETMDNFDSTLRDWGFYDKDACVGEPSFDDPCWKLESKTSDELIEECIKFSQEAKHVKCVLKDAGQDIDTLFDYLDSRALCDQNVSAAIYIMLFIEDVIKGLRTDWCGEFEGKQDLKDLMEKYKEPLPETRKMAEKQAMIEKDGSITPAPDDYEFTEADELPL